MAVQRRIFRTGGVPEHFNAPWHLAMQEQIFDESPFAVDWQTTPGGTGALTEALRNRDLDIAVLLTEGIVADIANGSDACIVGTYVASPLVWGVHVHATSPMTSIREIAGRRFAISRFGSGSHLMTFVEADNQGWGESEAPRFVRVGNLDGAVKALREEHADVFLWEKYTTKPVVDRGEWRRIGEVPTPWPAFVFAATPEVARGERALLDGLIATIGAYCARVMADPDTSIPYIATQQGLREEDVRAWFATTEWRCESRVDRGSIDHAASVLARIGVIEPDTVPRVRDAITCA